MSIHPLQVWTGSLHVKWMGGGDTEAICIVQYIPKFLEQEDASRRRDPFVPESVRTFNVLYADECRCMHKDARMQMLTSQYSGKHKHTQMHTDTKGRC